MIRVMLNTKNMAYNWWAEVANTAVHIIDKVFLRAIMDKIAYEIWKGRKAKLNYFHVFGRKCYILRDREHLGKFDTRGDEWIFLGYSINSHTFCVFNKNALVL